ncbi:MAG: sugar kinase, partial [Treponema sp.]|nr:sugar kinase [Treponema sp.]
MGRCFLCADIGTSALKAALIDPDGRKVAFTREPYPLERVATGKIRSSDWEEALACGWARLASQEPGVRPAAICISGNGPTLVPLTVDGETLAPLHWYNPRIPDATAPSL